MSEWSQQPGNPHDQPGPQNQPGAQGQPGAAGQPGPYGQPDPWGVPAAPGVGWPGAPGIGTPPYGVPQWYPGPGMFDPGDPLISPDYAGWWARSMTILRAGWRPLLLLQLVTAAFSLISEAPAEVFRALQRADARPSPGSFAAEIGTGPVAFGILAAAVFVAVVTLLTTLASIRTAVLVATGGRPQPGAELRAGARRLLPMLGWALLGGLLTIAALLACILPIFYVVAVLTVLPAVVLFERGSGIGRCFQLVHAAGRPAFARLATIMGVLLVGVLVRLVAELIIGFGGPGTGWGGTTQADSTIVATALLRYTVEVVVTAVVTLVMTVLAVTTYADLRARHEPLTTGILTQELQVP